MPKRSALAIVLGICLALMIIGAASGIEAGGRIDPSSWIGLHARTLVIAFCALFILIVVSIFGTMFARLAEQQRLQSAEQSKQLAIMMERTADLAKLNDDYSEQIRLLEAAAATRQADFDAETRRLVEQSYHALTGRVDAQSRQLEAVNMALQYQRAEIRDVSYTLKIIESSGGIDHLSLSGPERPAITAGNPASIEPPETARESVPGIPDARPGLIDITQNDRGTQVVDTVEFDVAPPAAALQVSSFLAPSRAFLIPTIPNTDDERKSTSVAPKADPENGERAISDSSAVSSSKPANEDYTYAVAESAVALGSLGPEDALAEPSAIDSAEAALSSLMIEAQEALSSLRAQVEAASGGADDASSQPAESHADSLVESRRRWQIRF